MIFRKHLKKIHFTLSKDVESALYSSSGDHGYVKLLFIAQLISTGALFFTQDAAAHLIIIYMLIPLILLPLRFEEKTLPVFKIPIPVKISFYNVFRNALLCRTPLFIAVVIYGADKAFLSYLYPEPVLGYLHIFFYYLLAPLLAFIIATIRLAVDMPSYYGTFFRIIAPLAALNALINFYLFLKTIPAISFLGIYRLQSSFGAAMGYNSNLDALIHSVFLVGIIISMINSKSNSSSALGTLTILILFCAIMLEQSRGCIIAIIISLTFYAMSWKSMISSRIIYAAILCFVLSLVYIFVVLPDGFNTYLSRPNHLRLEIWLKFFNVIRKNSFVGLGDRTIFAIPLSDGEIAPHPHNLLLSSLVRGGVIGLFSYFYIIISGLRQTYLYAMHSHNAIPFCVFLNVTIAGIFDFDLKVWQSGWYLAGYWLAIAHSLAADAALRNEKCEPVTIQPRPQIQK